jgi:O-antigen/teichoic acid export membrane protein
MKKDLIITFITEFFVLASGLLVYKLAANYLGSNGFSEYTLTRRNTSFLQPLLLLGLGVGIPRYVAYATTKKDSLNPDIYFISGFFILLFVSFISLGLINILKDTFAFLMFGSSNYASFILPISLMLLGLLFHSICYSYLRGRLQMLRANLLQIINAGLIPLLAFLIKDIKGVLFITGSGWIIFSILFFLFFIIKSMNFDDVNVTNIKASAKELLFYGIQRVPGDFGLAALLTLPFTFTAHIAGIKEAGYVAFGISLLNMAGAVFAPIGVILLPKVSQLIGNGDMRHLKYYVLRLLKITFFLTITGVVLFEIFADKIISLYLGKGFSDLVMVTRIIMISSIGFNIFLLMRNVIDAYHTRAINTINILISLLLFLILAGMTIFFGKKHMYLIICLIPTIYFLSILTMVEIRKILKQTQIC